MQHVSLLQHWYGSTEKWSILPSTCFLVKPPLESVDQPPYNVSPASSNPFPLRSSTRTPFAIETAYQSAWTNIDFDFDFDFNRSFSHKLTQLPSWLDGIDREELVLTLTLTFGSSDSSSLSATSRSVKSALTEKSSCWLLLTFSWSGLTVESGSCNSCGVAFSDKLSSSMEDVLWDKAWRIVSMPTRPSWHLVKLTTFKQQFGFLSTDAKAVAPYIHYLCKELFKRNW